MPFLRFESGPLAGNVYAFELRCVVGRHGGCDVQLLGAKVSRQHAVFSVDEAGQLVVADLGSGNGTHVGGEAITRRAIAAGDVVTIGDSTISVHLGDPPAVAEGEPQVVLTSGPASAATVGVTSDAPCLEHALAMVRGLPVCPGCGKPFSK